MLSVEETIQQVEQLYVSITGREPPPANGLYPPIPPEKDPGLYVEQSMDRLQQALAAAGARFPATQAPTWTPPVDLAETETEHVVLVDLPGVDRASVQIAVGSGVLTIAGDRPAALPAGATLRRAERVRGRFVRQLGLGPGARADEAVARWSEGGVLEIRIPKGAHATASQRLIDIQ